jgi:Glutaredoxin and related proteins
VWRVPKVNITLIGRDECPLCDDARKAINDVIAGHSNVEFEEVNLEDNPLWKDLYGELIPVVLINGEEHAHWKVEPDTLRQAIHDATALA